MIKRHRNLKSKRKILLKRIVDLELSDCTQPEIARAIDTFCQINIQLANFKLTPQEQREMQRKRITKNV